MNLRKFQVIKGSEITRLLAPPPSVFVDEPPREPRVRRQEELRRELESDGSIFQATSDTEVILHLVARSR